MSTVIKIVKHDVSEEPKNKVSIIKYTPASTKSNPGQGDKGSQQRDRLYQAYFRKNFPGSTVEKEGSETYIYLKKRIKGKEQTTEHRVLLKLKLLKLTEVMLLLKKLESLKNRENATPHDKRQANWFINFHSKNESSDPESGEAAPYGSGYSPVEEVVMPYIQELTEYMGQEWIKYRTTTFCRV
jgi:hypothetical protein